jgi:hypothetical protein
MFAVVVVVCSSCGFRFGVSLNDQGSPFRETAKV